MVVCRKGSSGEEMAWEGGAQQRDARHQKPGEGGPVFLPRRKPSPFTEALLATISTDLDRVTAYDDDWFAGRPTI